MNTRLRMTRTIDEREQPWMADEDTSVKSVAKDCIVYRYDGATYGCVSERGIAVTLEPGQTPFFEVPADSVAPAFTECRAWAVVDGNEIIINTVHDSRRGAIVNWLVVRKNLMATIFTTDDEIEARWEEHSQGARRVARVLITEEA